MNDTNPIWVFVSSFAVAALAGLAALLRSASPVKTVGVISAVLNSGLLGLGISLLWYTQYKENVYFLIGICVMAGLGGMTTVDFVLQAIRRGGFSISVGKDTIKMNEPEPEAKPEEKKDE